MSFAEEMRVLTNMNKSSKNMHMSSIDTLAERKRKSDIRFFFNTYVKMNAKELMKTEAEKGFSNALLFLYDYYDYFYITPHDEFVFLPGFSSNTGHFLYRIYAVIRDPYFISLMDEYFVNELGVIYDYTRLINVSSAKNGIEVFWGSISDPNISEKWFKKLTEKFIAEKRSIVVAKPQIRRDMFQRDDKYSIDMSPERLFNRSNRFGTN